MRATILIKMNQKTNKINKKDIITSLNADENIFKTKKFDSFITKQIDCTEQISKKLMFELCRKIVAGPKKKFEWNGKQLDLTYVTDRIIAMAFPASGLESAYRNSIKDVAQFLHEKHGSNFMIINVSSRKYDYKFFNNNVLEYEWRDHLSPPLSTLWEIGREMYEYLRKNKNNVVAVHCNHGKGRTGTTIISFLMFTGFFQKFDEALNFYNKRRFVSLTYGVSQPCQKRYLNYFEILRSRSSLSPKLISYKIKNIRQKGLPNQKYFLEISSIRRYEPKYKGLLFNQNSTKLYPNVPLMGDICIQLFMDKWNGQEEIAMVNCHTFFFDGTQNMIKIDQDFLKNIIKNQKLSNERSQTNFSLSTTKQQKFHGRNIKINGKHSAEFQIIIDFEWYCYCHLQKVSKSQCPCQQERIVEQKYWRKTIQSVEVSKKITKLQACSLISTIEYLHQDKQQDKKPQHNSKKALEKKNSLKKNSIQSNDNTETSPIGSDQQKQGGASDKGMEFSNSLPNNSLTNKTEDYYQNDQFEYDMVVVNRNSTNSV